METALHAVDLTICQRTLQWLDPVIGGRFRQTTLDRYRAELAALPGGGNLEVLFPDRTSLDGGQAGLLAESLIAAERFNDAFTVLSETYTRLEREGTLWAYANAMGCQQLGDLYRRRGNSEQAQQWYRHALRCYPLYRAAMVALGELCVEANPDEAAELLFRAHGIFDFPPILQRLTDRSVVPIENGPQWSIFLYQGLYFGFHGLKVMRSVSAIELSAILNSNKSQAAPQGTERWQPVYRTQWAMRARGFIALALPLPALMVAAIDYDFHRVREAIR